MLTLLYDKSHIFVQDYLCITKIKEFLTSRYIQFLSIYILDFYLESSIMSLLGGVTKSIVMMSPSKTWLKQFRSLTVSGE